MKSSILKFDDVDQFVYGTNQLIHFVEFRNYIKNQGQNKMNKFISLELVFKKQQETDYKFPPIGTQKPEAFFRR
jgi:hypothetical protein